MNISPRPAALRLRLDGATYADIGAALGVSRQRAQQLLSPPGAIRAVVVARASGLCQRCARRVDDSGHVHHRAAVGLEPDAYGDLDNLELLCLPCHRSAHLSVGVR